MKANSMRVDHVVTDGTFVLYGVEYAVQNNVWVVGNDDEVLIIDASHNSPAIMAAVGDRAVSAIALTHGHPDHINVAHELVAATDAPALMHPADEPFWHEFQPGQPVPKVLVEGDQLTAGGLRFDVMHTPGHSPGSICLVTGDVVFSGDTLFNGGPGATDRPRSSLPDIINSIRDRLLVLPLGTVVRPGHGPSTTIGAEVAPFAAFLAAVGAQGPPATT